MSQRVLDLPSHVASVAPRDLDDARRVVAVLPEAAGAVEYRLDLAAERMPVSALLALDPRPAIVTWRSVREGGRFDGGADEYRALVLEAYEAGATVDVEHASGLLTDRALFPDRSRVVVSAHFAFALPRDPEAELSAMGQAGARVVKLVAGAGDLHAALETAALQSAARPFPLSVFPMGPASAPGRVLSAHLGAALVYGSAAAPTARGQLSVADLAGTYGTATPFLPEALYGIVAGDPSRSLSPRLHNALFRARGLRFLYLPLPMSDFGRENPPELQSAAPFRGFSITRPWKRAAASAGIPSEDVRATGAANTLVARRGRWRADNTDVDGIFDPLADHDTGEGRSAVVLGAGGTARAAVVAARRLGYDVVIASRSDEAADAVAAELKVDAVAWSDVSETEADLYVNTTPVGMSDGDGSAVPERVLENRPLVFDCVYRQSGETATVAAARRARCPVIDGLSMFAAQALRQARLFGVSDAGMEEVREILSEAVS
ncbi:MAG: type I 3-dehydroquinate dehydratase [Acidobacteria bacterium]|nr:type I 3-dehydroquinate dehydratase [Acidobacteriota bacterium]